MTETKSKKSHHVSTSHEGEEPMKKTASTRSHASTKTAAHEGEKAMKTTKHVHTDTPTDATTKEGTTTMKTQPTTTTASAPAPATEASKPDATTSYVAACTALLDQFDTAFPKGANLTTLDKKRTAKAKKGSERYLPQLIALAKQHGLSIASVPLEAIASDSAEAQALVPLQKQMERLNKRVETRVFATLSSSWSGATKLYSVLKRLSKDDGELASGLQPVEQYFNHRHPDVAKQHPKTKKGKAALAAEKEAAANAVEGAPATASTAETAAPPPTVANGAAVTNGVAHS